MIDKSLVFNEIREDLLSKGYKIIEENLNKPWGGYFRIDNPNIDKFISEHFPNLGLTGGDLELSPKILIAAPRQRLSWQYHYRRSEIWRFLTDGKYVRSLDDIQPDPELAEAGAIIRLGRGERHRLIGGDEFTIVAEIWEHTEPGNPSNEDDIVRIEDDYNR